MDIQKSKILHIVTNNYSNDNRVRRAAECGYKLGSDISIYALSDLPVSQQIIEGGIYVSRFHLATRRLPKIKLIQSIKYLELTYKMMRNAIRCKPTLIHAHDLDGAIIAYLITRVVRCRYIYDSHEFWADAGFLPSKSFFSKVIVQIEKKVARKAIATITVSDNIAKLLAKQNQIELPIVVRNVPERWPANVDKKLRAALNLSETDIVILYQGVINGDGVIDLIKAFEKSTGNAVLVFLGNGTKVDELKNYSDRMSKRVYFHPSVFHNELPSFTGGADIGVHSMVGTNLNRINALPNKLFEYIQGGLAVIISNLPEMKKIVETYNIGLTYENGNVEELTKKIDYLISHETARRQYKIASLKAAEVLNWENEKGVLERLYKSLIKDLADA